MRRIIIHANPNPNTFYIRVEGGPSFEVPVYRSRREDVHLNKYDIASIATALTSHVERFEDYDVKGVVHYDDGRKGPETDIDMTTYMALCAEFNKAKNEMLMGEVQA